MSFQPLFDGLAYTASSKSLESSPSIVTNSRFVISTLSFLSIARTLVGNFADSASAASVKIDGIW